ncbi:MAG: ABC transporter ATP-binding protein [Oscillospiraceae bacterium]|nr:ABC transporter ATP-binding protein [Oscillospiraceae bacterium]
MAEIKLENIFKTYEGGVRALGGVSLRVKEGEFLSLLGPSGCGKTTLLRVIAGLEKPDSGEVYIGGRLVNDTEPSKRGVALVFQSYGLYEHMSAFENIAFPLRARGLSKEEIDAAVRESAVLLEIEELLGRRAGELSGGQQQRVSMARALACRPSVLLMDEPLSNLDARLRTDMRLELLSLKKRLKAAVVYVTHDQDEAMALGDRIALMEGGTIKQEGSPAELYERPTDIFTAGFIGSPAMNLLEARLEREGEELFIVLGSARAALGSKRARELLEKGAPGEEIILGLRPERLRLLPPGSPDTLLAELEYAEMLGGETRLHLVSPLGRLIARVFSFEGCAGGHCGGLAPGALFGVDFEAGDAHLFSKETQKRL